MAYRSCDTSSVTMFVGILDQRPSPGEEEVAGAGPERYRDAQPHVVRHEDEHEEVAEDDLDDMEQRLKQMDLPEHHRPAAQRKHVKQLHGEHAGLYLK